MYGNFQLARVFFILHPVTTCLARYLRQKSNPQLCFDLSRAKHGRFGRQTVEVSNDNVQWFLGHEEVTEGPCGVSESSEILNNREMKRVTYCKHDGTARNGREHEILSPRFLDSYMSDKGVSRGECMDAGPDDTAPQARHPQSGIFSSTEALCFDLQEYGMQTIGVEKKTSKWFLRDSNVSRGPCDRASVNLDDRETEMVTYCKHFGSARKGYEYEIQAPRFLSDYLHEKKGAERGECSDSNPGKVHADFVPEYFASVAGDIGKLNDKPRPKPNNNSKSKPDKGKPSAAGVMSCTCVESKPGSGKIKPNKSKNEPDKNKPDKNKPDKNKPSRSKSGKNKPKPRPNPKPNNVKPYPAKPNPKPNNSKPSPARPNPKPNNSKPSPPRPKPNGNSELEQNFGPQTSSESSEDSESCKDCICDGITNGFVQRPNTECKEYVQCYEGCVSQVLKCEDSLVFDSNLQICNWVAECGPGPSCDV